MNKVIFTTGLPGSGKSTWAKEYIKKYTNWKRVSRDDFRLMIADKAYEPKNEKLVTKLVNTCIIEILKDGKDVIIDATHLNEKYINEIKNFIKNNYDKEISYDIKSFLHVTVEECIKNDLERPNSVGSGVICGMYEKYLDKRSIYILSGNKPQAYIVDLDGTLAKMRDRSPFEWDKVDKDIVRENIRHLVHLLYIQSNVIIFSGRDGSCEELSKKWLKENVIVYDEIYFRKPGDTRKDSIVKQELFNEHVLNKYDVLGVIDDRPQVIRMWKQLGLTVFSVDDRMYHTEF